MSAGAAPPRADGLPRPGMPVAAALTARNLPLRAAALPPQSVVGEASEGAVAPEARLCDAPSEAKP